MDIDGRDFVDDAGEPDHKLDEPVQQVIEGGEREHLETGEERERAEVRDLTGRECIEQNPEMWKQFNGICDDEEKFVERAEQDDDVPELIDSEQQQ